MRSHWGAGITGAFILFAAAVLVMVYISMNQRVDLVSDDYYDKELKHQDRIDEVRRTQRAGSAPLITEADGIVRIAFPRAVDRAGLNGEVVLYRPSDRRLDVRTPLQLDSANVQSMVASAMAKGKWRVQVRWTAGSSTFYHEDTVMVR